MLSLMVSVVVISLSGALMPGPLFAVMLTKSYKSPWAGTQVSLGHAVIEVPLILLIYFGLANFFQNSSIQLVLSLAGGGMIVWMGISMFRARKAVVREGQDYPLSSFKAGIILTGLNPFFILWWATVGSLLVMKLVDFGAVGLSAFIMVHWLVDLLWLSLVSFTVFRTHHLWGQKAQEGVFVVCSLLLLVFGVRFILSGVGLLD